MRIKAYKVWYALGLIFMGLFALSSLYTINVFYVLLSLISFIMSATHYEED